MTKENELPSNPKRWTTDEIDYLKENIGFRRIKDIAKTLGRTETAVTIKLKRLGLGSTRSVSGKVTSGELAQIFGIDRNTVKWWIIHHGLPATKKVTCKKRKYTLISPENFWDWAKDHRERIDFSKVAKNSLPPEPSWLDEERRNPSFQKRNYRGWSTKEDQMLAAYIDEGLSYKEIAEIMNRSFYSVEKRYHRIKDMKQYYKGCKPYAIKPGKRYSLRKDAQSGE